MIILVPEEKNDGKWIGADDISTTSAYGDARRSYSAVLEPASFRGIWVVYDVEHSKIACAYPIAFANSDKMSTSIEEEKHSYSIRDKQNAYNKMIGDNLAANFKKAVIALYNDSLGVPDNKTRINPY